MYTDLLLKQKSESIIEFKEERDREICNILSLMLEICPKIKWGNFSVWSEVIILGINLSGICIKIP